MPTAKKAAGKKAPAKKVVAKRATAKKAATVKATARSAGKAGATSSSAVKAAARPPAKKASAKEAPAKHKTSKATAAVAAPKEDTLPVKKDAPTKADDTDKAVFDEEFLEAQRQLLIEERATYLRQAESLQAEADSLAELREPGDVQFDEESGEGDTLAVERERDLALSARARQEIEEIDRALAKIDAGTYGICEVSGLPIPRARLQAIPQARERVEYKVGGFGRR